MNYFVLEVTLANGCLKLAIFHSFHLQTSDKYTCSHPGHNCDSNYTHSLTSFRQLQLSANDHLPRLRKIFIAKMVALQGKRTALSASTHAKKDRNGQPCANADPRVVYTHSRCILNAAIANFRGRHVTLGFDYPCANQIFTLALPHVSSQTCTLG